MPAGIPDETELSVRKEMILSWILDSGILNRRYWALHHSYDAFRRRYGPLYTEVTGYGIKSFLNYISWTGNPLFLESAQKLAGFIHSSKTLLGNGNSSYRFGYDPLTGLWNSRAYSFDTAICISSILDLNQQTMKLELAKGALESGYWLVRNMQNEDGSFKACLDVVSRRYISMPIWFGDRGSLHAKIAMSLYKLYEHSRDHTFLESFNSCLNWALTMQKNSGEFLARQGEHYVFTHSHCYASEALAFAYGKVGDERHLTGLKKSIEWLVRHQNKDGSYFESYGLLIPSLWKRVDATAQACRLFLLMYLIDPNRTYLKAAERAAKFLEASQITGSRDRRLKGGLRSRLILSFKWPELNSWTNLFAIHALHLLERLAEYDFTRAIRELF